jgi:ferrous iron transport protein B
VGNANVGKSVIFNELTGMSQIIGNWPGKTIEQAKGTLIFNNTKFEIIDLPGIYSLSTYSLEEIVSREHIVEEKPDIIVNVLDATQLERNLFLTYQVMLLGKPMILVLNQYDVLKNRGYEVDVEKIKSLLGLPCVLTVAVHNIGVHEIMEEVIELEKNGYKDAIPKVPPLGKEINEVILSVKNVIKKYQKSSDYNIEFATIKIIEGDSHIQVKLGLRNNPEWEKEYLEIKNKIKKIEDIHGEDISTILSADIYHVIHRIALETVYSKKTTRKETVLDLLNHLTTHSVFGYIILGAVLFIIYFSTFQFGDLISISLDELYEHWSVSINETYGEDNFWKMVLWDGGFGSFIGAVGGVLPYVVPFYFFIEILQDSGYLPRAAYLMDSFMHRLKVHGKAIIPIILGFGCNVPACTGCVIMETKEEKERAIFLTTLIPCAAVSVIVMGIVGKYMGFGWVLLVYLFNFIGIIIIAKLSEKIFKPGTSELIMEMHQYRVPNYKVVFKQTWMRSKEFFTMAIPLIVAIGMIMEIMMMFNVLEPLNTFLSPVTVLWLGLPAATGIFIIYGILRKELGLVLITSYIASVGITMAQFMSPMQMVVFSLFMLLYFPCVATIVAVAKTTDWKFALKLSIIEIVFAIVYVGAIRWIWELILLI